MMMMMYAQRVSECYSPAGAGAAVKCVTDNSGSMELSNKLLDQVGGHYIAEKVTPQSIPSFVVFLDEVNTSSILGSVQDVMLDNSLDNSLEDMQRPLSMRHQIIPFRHR